MKKVRCAVYTRKSTQKGLDMEFNSLDAQREAGEAYVKSQRHEGWEILDEVYEDGGFSGGNIERPGLKKLIKHIEQGFVDMVVVYKIDRLTRSLYDFSNMIKKFDKHNVSFVSVTQQFNTSTSMGRLTLNVLLSFAQFEREVSGERIRDKISASKRKGMWMGGRPMLGYDIQNRKLVINKEEAKLVNIIYEKFLETGSYIETCNYINNEGYRTKSWETKSGKIIEGRLFMVSSIKKLIKNPLYIGKISHKGQYFDGEHEPILSKELFDKVCRLVNTRADVRIFKADENKKALLSGLIYCGCCDCRMVATSTHKGNKRYRYYVSRDVYNKSYRACSLGNIPADDIENIVINKVQEQLKNKEFITDVYNHIEKQGVDINKDNFIRKMRNINTIWDYLCPEEIKKIITLLVGKVIVYKDNVEIYFNKDNLLQIGALRGE